MNGFAPWLGVARAPFLLLPVTLVASGVAAAAYKGAFGWHPTLLAVVGLVLLHSAVNALNEASDMASGIDLRTTRTPFSGGSGTLPAGRLSVRTTRAFAYACAVGGGLIGGWFALRLDPLFSLLMGAGAAAVLSRSPAGPGTRSNVYVVGMRDLLRCGEVAKRCGVSPDTVRHYERIGLLPRATRTAAGYRQYPDSACRRVQVVRSALRLGFTLRELGEVMAIRDGGGTPCHGVRRLIGDRFRRIEAELRELLRLRRRLNSGGSGCARSSSLPSLTATWC